ncbi:MAG: acsA [Acidobacteria bacterium]|nr:acsA [Acidobacteriota bacterium]
MSTTRFASGLAGIGVGVGDPVGFYLPMCTEVVVALLACLKLGAVPVPVFAGFGPDALAGRLADAGARVLLTADGTVRRGKSIDLKPAADAAADLAACVERVVVLRRRGGEACAGAAARRRGGRGATSGGTSSRQRATPGTPPSRSTPRRAR